MSRRFCLLSLKWPHLMGQKSSTVFSRLLVNTELGVLHIRSKWPWNVKKHVILGSTCCLWPTERPSCCWYGLSSIPVCRICPNCLSYFGRSKRTIHSCPPVYGNWLPGSELYLDSYNLSRKNKYICEFERSSCNWLSPLLKASKNKLTTIQLQGGTMCMLPRQKDWGVKLGNMLFNYQPIQLLTLTNLPGFVSLYMLTEVPNW